jgi:hypothetical protein
MAKVHLSTLKSKTVKCSLDLLKQSTSASTGFDLCGIVDAMHMPRHCRISAMSSNPIFLSVVTTFFPFLVIFCERFDCVVCHRLFIPLVVYSWWQHVNDMDHTWHPHQSKPLMKSVQF